MFAICAFMGPSELKQTWLTLKTLEIEVKMDLYGFVTFFSSENSKNKNKKVVSKVFFDTGNPLKFSKKRVSDVMDELHT